VSSHPTPQSADVERQTFAATYIFLKDRMMQQKTLNWALKLSSAQSAERRAVSALIERPFKKFIKPWPETWRLVEEAWNATSVGSIHLAAITIERRLKGGDHSGSIIDELVRTVSPQLEITARPSVKKPKDIHQLLSISFTSADAIDPAKFGIYVVQDRQFLGTLASALIVSIDRTLETGHRLGWNASLRWRLGEVHRVYWHKPGKTESEPDEFGHGIASIVKTLFSVIERLGALDAGGAKKIISNWQENSQSLYRRLWAALARENNLATPDEVGQFLLSCKDEEFWNLHTFPEIAEVRAVRFADLAIDVQVAILSRIRKGPPRKMWRRIGSKEFAEAKTYWALREFKRIEATGNKLPATFAKWVIDKIEEHPELKKGFGVREGFYGGVEAHYRVPNPETAYNSLAGIERLDALEKALNSKRGGWENDPAERARDWLSIKTNILAVVADLLAVNHPGDYAQLFERLGWSYVGTLEAGTKEQRLAEFSAFSKLIQKLPKDAVAKAIDGLSSWTDSWKSVGADEPKQLISLFDFLWPIAVVATNSRADVEKPLDLNLTARVADDREPMDLDTLNTPAGRLVGVFFELWSQTPKGQEPFAPKSALRRMRDKLFRSDRRSGQIVRHRFVAVLNIFLNADPAWTESKLVPLLQSNEESSTALWRALGRRRIYEKLMRLIAPELVRRATDVRLGRETRKSLLFSLVVELLHAMLRNKRPPVTGDKIQQLLRSVNEEVRVHVANIPMQFLRDNVSGGFTQEQLFAGAVKPFFERVWPQERDLVTPGVSKAFADMPAFAKGDFCEAVAAIERFLVPCDCWSLFDYGFYEKGSAGVELESVVKSAQDARALLKLLDLTIGHEPDSVVPHDLEIALNRIGQLDKNSDSYPTYKRLAAISRRYK